jgi:prephenate dehydrogenase
MTTTSSFPRIGFIGLGLMGGSLAKLIKAHYPKTYLAAVAPSAKTRNYAIQKNIVTAAFETIDTLPSLDLVFVCTPLEKIVSSIHTLSKHQSKSLVITDIGSIKASIIDQVSLSNPDHVFIPGHPMAGIEKTGIEHANETILKKAPYLIMPTHHAKFNIFSDFLTTLSFNVIALSSQDHDKLVGLASHFAYLMASITSKTATQDLSPSQQDLFKQLLGPGFRDTTRIARSDPRWGTEVCLENKEVLLTTLEKTKDAITQIQSLIKDENTTGLFNYLSSIKETAELTI